jgi:hypothetical protein
LPRSSFRAQAQRGGGSAYAKLTTISPRKGMICGQGAAEWTGGVPLGIRCGRSYVGEAFLATLADTQRRHVTGLIGLQRQDLAEIVSVRRAIAAELRRFLTGDSADKDKVLSLSKRYGELDGEMSYLYATAFANVGKTLTAQQKEKLAGMRTSNPSDPKGPFLYSTPIHMPKIESTAFVFGM